MPVTPQQLYEQTLVLRSQIGDEAAFTELLELHGPRLLLFARRMLQSSPDRVADVIQETWVAIFRALPRLADPGKFMPWALRIARDRIYQEYRRRKPPQEPLDSSDVAAQAVEVAGQEPTVDREELLLHLNKISPEQREALLLHYFEDMSYEDAARVMGTSVGTVRSRIHYGKRALRHALEGNSV